MHDIFSYAEEGAKLRDAGIAQALDHSSDWKSLALIELEQIWSERRNEGNEFTFEMLKAPVIRTCGMPNSNNCWGGIAQKMIKRGWIVFTGKICNAQSVSRHASMTKVYRWVS